MQTIEITAKTIDDAKKQAAAQLGVDIDQISVTVIEEQKGLFGKGTVRVQAAVTSSESAAPAPKASKAKAASKKVAEEPFEVKEEKPAPKAPAKKSTSKKSKPAAVAAVEMPDEAVAEAGEGEEAAGPQVEATPADEARIKELLLDMLDAAGLDVEVSGTSCQGKYVNIELDGKDVGHLVGKHGEVLNALQYLLNVTVTHQIKNGVRATIDGGSYRRKREEALTKLATNIATEVKKRQEEAVLDALPAFERRVIHKVLAEFDGVATYSEGEEPNRRVVIAPSEA